VLIGVKLAGVILFLILPSLQILSMDSRKRNYYSIDEFMPNIRRREYSRKTKSSLAEASKYSAYLILSILVAPSKSK
jgi:hypothetical protein